MTDHKLTDQRAGRRTGGLSHELIVKTALHLVNKDGLEALTMRRLGAALSVDPMAVYHYVPNKQALVEALVERVFSGFAPPMDGEGWQARVRDWARSYRDLALQHRPLVLQIVTDQQATAATAARLADPALIDAIRASGLTNTLQRTAADTIVDFVHGFILGEATLTREAADRFERGLDILVVGVEAMAER